MAGATAYGSGGNRAGYGYGGNRTGYGFGLGAGAGYGANGYWSRPGYNNFPRYGYGYGYGNSYPYYNNQYLYGSPYYGTSGAVVNSAAPDVTTGWLNMLGVDAQSVVDSTGPAVQVAAVFTGSPAAQAGVLGGDVIHTANGYLTRYREELAREIANTPRNGVLGLSVRSLGDVSDHAVRVVVP
jgi:hypothetical protein